MQRLTGCRELGPNRYITTLESTAQGTLRAAGCGGKTVRARVPGSLLGTSLSYIMTAWINLGPLTTKAGWDVGKDELRLLLVCNLVWFLTKLKLYHMTQLHLSWTHTQRTPYPTTERPSHPCLLLLYSQEQGNVIRVVFYRWMENTHMVPRHDGNSFSLKEKWWNYKNFSQVDRTENFIVKEVTQAPKDKFGMVLLTCRS